MALYRNRTKWEMKFIEQKDDRYMDGQLDISTIRHILEKNRSSTNIEI